MHPGCGKLHDFACICGSRVTFIQANDSFIIEYKTAGAQGPCQFLKILLEKLRRKQAFLTLFKARLKVAILTCSLDRFENVPRAANGAVSLRAKAAVCKVYTPTLYLSTDVHTVGTRSDLCTYQISKSSRIGLKSTSILIQYDEVFSEIDREVMKRVNYSIQSYKGSFLRKNHSLLHSFRGRLGQPIDIHASGI